MINASSEFKKKIKEGCRVVNYADIVLRDGTTLHLDPSDFTADGFTMTDKTSDGKFGVGFAIGKTINLTIANHTNKFSLYDFYQAIIYMYVAVVLDDGTVLKERKGKYYVISPSTPGEVIALSGVDSMHLFDKPYNAKTSYPATLQTILSDCCLDCGVMIGFKQFDMYNFTVSKRPEDVTYRQVVSWVAQIAGYNARINNNDYLELIWYDTSFMNTDVIDGGNFLLYENDNIIDGGNFEKYTSDNIIDGGLFTDAAPMNVIKIGNLTVGTDDVYITGVTVKNGETERSVGTSGYMVRISENPLTEGVEEKVAKHLGSKLISMRFRPFNCDTTNNPLYESYDACYVYDRKGNAYYSIINSINYSINGFTQIACLAEDPIRNESSYVSESARAIVEARRNTQKQLSTYDKAVQNMNMLASNAMGYHTTYEEQEDGSRITYLHDKANLEDSTIIYKQTIDGFFVSQDGGKTYTLGFDSEGNAVVNILYAIGIVADWIRGGTLTLGGENNIDGSCVIYNSSGKEIGRFDKDGIFTNSAHITGGTIDISTNDTENSKIILRGKSGNSNNMLMLFPNRVSVIEELEDEKFSASMTGSTIIMSSSKFLCSFGWNGILFDSLRYYNQNKLKINNTEISSGSIKIMQGTFETIYLNDTQSKINGWNISENSIRSKNEEYIFSTTACWFNKNVHFGGIDIIDSHIHMQNGKDIYMVYGNIYMTYGAISASNSELNINNIKAKSLSVTGTKSRIANTDNYSDRLLYCYEMPKPYFGDIGEAVLDEDGICYVFIDDIFYETINTNCQYQVFLQKYGQGDVWIKERTSTYFVAEGTPNLPFGWELKARQAGFENERLEKFVEKEEEKSVDYELEANNYINNYYKEMINYEESN